MAKIQENFGTNQVHARHVHKNQTALHKKFTKISIVETIKQLPTAKNKFLKYPMFTIKTFKHMKFECSRQKSACALRFFLIYFCLGRKIVPTLRNKMIFFYLLYEQYVIAVKAYLNQVQKAGTAYLRIETRVFSENF